MDYQFKTEVDYFGESDTDSEIHRERLRLNKRLETDTETDTVTRDPTHINQKIFAAL